MKIFIRNQVQYMIKRYHFALVLRYRNESRIFFLFHSIKGSLTKIKRFEGCSCRHPSQHPAQWTKRHHLSYPPTPFLHLVIHQSLIKVCLVQVQNERNVALNSLLDKSQLVSTSCLCLERNFSSKF